MTDNSSEKSRTESRLREALQDRYRDNLLQLVIEAEDRMVDRKDHLVDLLDSGVVGPGEYAAKVNRVVGVFLHDIADVVGTEACKKMYDFGPEDDVQLLDPRKVTAEPRHLNVVMMARIVADELTFAGNRLHALGDRTSVQQGWLELIRTSTVEADLSEYLGLKPAYSEASGVEIS